MLSKRGVLIVLEGCDKAGKSTQARMLHEAICAAGRICHLMNFPDRTTPIGKVLDGYLRCTTDVKDEAIHLMFSANRWELVPKILQLLNRGESVIVDRYAFSGVAFTAAKGNLDLEWCMSPDMGLPQPDRVFFLNLSKDLAATRDEYGQERYENPEFQEKVKSVFMQLNDSSYWTTVDAGHSIEEVHQNLLKLTLELIHDVESTPRSMKLLWKPSVISSDEDEIVQA